MLRPAVAAALKAWSVSKARKPLIVRGARQVGKTWAIENFAAQHFTQQILLNFEKNRALADIFEQDLDPHRIVRELAHVFKLSPLKPGRDILIFDEIQECPRALTSLKYFCEDVPELHVIAAGSLLGVRIGEASFPVGKVEFFNMHPLDFSDFVRALAGDHWANALAAGEVPQVLHSDILKLLYRYYFVGGLPEAVSTWQQLSGDLLAAEAAVRKVHEGLINGYRADMAKHSGKENAHHISLTIDAVAAQLGETREGENVKRFRFKDVIPRKRSYAELEGPIAWLEAAGLVIRCKQLKRPEKPLEHFADANAFKLYLFDVGLLSYLHSLTGTEILSQSYGLAKGFFAENFVAMALAPHARDGRLYYWQGRSAEVEFVQAYADWLVPIEVKSGERFATKSLDSYVEKFQPKATILTSPLPLKIEGTQCRLPLYLAPFDKLREMV